MVLPTGDGLGHVGERDDQRPVVVCGDYVPLQWVQPLEQLWESAESDAGMLLKASKPRDIVADDERQRAGGGAVRRLMVVHLVRGLEGTLHARRLIGQQGVASSNDPETVWALRELRLQSGGLILPSRIERERVRETFEQIAAHGHAELLAGLYGKALAACEQHSMEIAVAPAGCEFVLGDAPAFTVGRAADGSAVVGLGDHKAPLGSGAMLVMPLGPTLCAVLSGNPLLNGVDTIDEQQVDWFNDIQCARAMRTVVCTRQAPSALVDRIASQVRGKWGHDAAGNPLSPPPGNGLPPAVWAAADVHPSVG